MIKELVFILCLPDDSCFSWEAEVFVNNVRSLGYTEEIRFLVFHPHDRLEQPINLRWLNFEKRQKSNNVRVFFYQDRSNFLQNHIKQVDYIPLLRLHLLAWHFDQYKELNEKAIYYCDSDTLFTKYLDFAPFLDDDICYLSRTNYLDGDYFESKFNDCISKEKETELRAIDPIERLSKEVGISLQIIRDNKENTGGAQYLLKNVNSEFWARALHFCKLIRFYLRNINAGFFESENKGYQSWCADMWAVLWTLWATEHKTQCPKEFDFAWATDKPERWDEVYIFHNSGDLTQPGFFNKRAAQYIAPYSQVTPFDDIKENNFTKEFCTYLYVEAILKTKKDLNYQFVIQKDRILELPKLINNG
jgi:hypothetical protein